MKPGYEQRSGAWLRAELARMWGAGGLSGAHCEEHAEYRCGRCEAKETAIRRELAMREMKDDAHPAGG